MTHINTKPTASKLMGHMSYGMVLAASDREGKERTVCELVAPPTGSKVGERVSLAGEDIAAFTSLPRDVNIDGRAEGSIWQRVAPGLRTDDKGTLTQLHHIRGDVM
jgi:tRNA-binding EMAP/Myf-like protein